MTRPPPACAEDGLGWLLYYLTANRLAGISGIELGRDDRERNRNTRATTVGLDIGRLGRLRPEGEGYREQTEAEDDFGLGVHFHNPRGEAGFILDGRGITNDIKP